MPSDMIFPLTHVVLVETEGISRQRQMQLTDASHTIVFIQSLIDNSSYCVILHHLPLGRGNVRPISVLFLVGSGFIHTKVARLTTKIVAKFVSLESKSFFQWWLNTMI